jgi:hypothetical protein
MKYIQNLNFGGFDVIIAWNSYHAFHYKGCWIFQNLNDNINPLAPNFWEINVQYYHLKIIMRQTNKQSVKKWNKLCIWTPKGI